MSRRQSVDRPGILSPPGPFLTPSPSPSIPASPRLQPSPSQSPFSHDVLIVTNNTITNTTQEQERKAATPSRRPSIHQINSGSPNAGTVVFQPSPSQSPAAAQTVVGITGNEFNTTLVGSNNISLNKKSGKRTPQSYVNYSHGGTVTTSGPLTATVLANSPKGSSKKVATVMHSPMTNPSSSPIINESPIASPSSILKPPTPQPMLQSLPVMNAGNQLLQFIPGPQLIQATQQQSVANQQRSQQVVTSTTIGQNSNAGQTTTGKNSRGHQQILPKPQQTSIASASDKTSITQSRTTMNLQHQANQIAQSHQQQTVVTTTSTANQQQAGQQIILPTGNLNTQPLLLNQLNQMPVIVQQNTPQGVQLILRPPTPQLAAPSLVIHNTRPQLQQQQPQQLLRILNTNGTMQLTAAPTFIVSSQANLIQQNLQTLKTNTQTGPITQLSGLHTAPRNSIAAAFNSQIIGQSMAQLQNLQLNGNLAQIQMPNGLNGSIISQLPAHFQHLPTGFNQLNLNQISSTNLQQQIAAAAAAAGAAAAFQSPPPPQVSEIQMPSVVSAQNIQFSTGNTPVNIAQSVTPQPQLIQSVTPEPIRNPTPTLQNVISHQGTTTVLVQPDSAMPTHAITANTILAKPQPISRTNSTDSVMTSEIISSASQGATTKPPKKPKPRKKKAQTTAPTTTHTTITTSTAACMISPMVTTTTPSTPSKGNKKDNQKQQQVYHPNAQPTSSRADVQPSPVTSFGKLDLANVMKLCGIGEDDDFMDNETEPAMTFQASTEAKQSAVNVEIQQQPPQPQQTASVVPTSTGNHGDIMITIPGGQNTDMPFTFSIPTSHCDTANQLKPIVTVSGNSVVDPTACSVEQKPNSNIDPQNIVIKIDQLDNVPPYTITIPRDEIQQSIQFAQAHGNQQAQFMPGNSVLGQHQHLARSLSIATSNSASIASFSSATPCFTTSIASSAPATFVNSHITLQSQINEIQNQLIGVSSSNSGPTAIIQMAATSQQPTVQIAPTSITTSTSMISTPITSSTTNAPTQATTATVKPRRKPAAKRNTKKIETIPTSVGNVPSQIGNIQISQVDATKVNANQTMPISNVVENKIQIMPIIDTSKTAQNQTVQQQQQPPAQQQNIQLQPVVHQQPQNIHQQAPPPQQQQQFIPLANIQASTSEPNKISLDNRSLQMSTQPSVTSGNITLPIISHQNAPQAATVFPQLTGSLSLTFEEDAGRFILRHDPNLPQDPQSQIILQAILSGALCNVTVVNEPFDKNKTLKNNVTLNPANVSVTTGASGQPLIQMQPQPLLAPQNTNQKPVTLPQIHNNNKVSTHQSMPLQSAPVSTQSVLPSNNTFISSEVQKRPPDFMKKPEPPTAMVNATPSLIMNPASPKLVALPKVEANQQLFTLNTITNQITHLSSNQTTAALGPMERLLIVPAGINAQQLAECLSQGQIHFNNIGQAAQAPDQHNQLQTQPPPPQMQSQNVAVPTSQPSNQIQQQIVRPQQQQVVQPLQQNPPAKQVANVAPIIDASKAKAEVKPKKTPKPRKPKACNDNINKAVKPIKKLDLNTKPSANPVQIVQPNTATKDLPHNQSQHLNLLRGTSGSNITTSVSNNIHPFQTTQSGNKLVGVTAPMQQISQQQRNLMISNNNQCNTSNSNNSNLGTNLNNSLTVSNMMTNQNTMPVTSLSSQQANLSAIHPSNVQLPTVTVTPKPQPEPVQPMPPLISVNATAPVPRVQTIQLTPQQQQLLKTVQMQIQQLSSRLQNKSLLANLNIPSDFNPNNPIYNKPLPQLSNIANMNDNEIHTALQRLFIEQQKILASGKLIPTIPASSPHAFMTATCPSPGPPQSVQPPPPSPNQAPSMQSMPIQNKLISTSTASAVIPNSHMKTEGQPIPANIVQPNNHNSTVNTQSSGVTNQQRIHIYPMQHQVQMQQQSAHINFLQQQQLQTSPPNSQLDLQTHVQMQIHPLHTPQLQQQQQQQQQQSAPQIQPVLPQSTANNAPRLIQSTAIKQQPMTQFGQQQLQMPPPQQQIAQPMQSQQSTQSQQQTNLLSPHQVNLPRTGQYQPLQHQHSMPISVPQGTLTMDNNQKQVHVETSSANTPSTAPLMIQTMPPTPVTVTIKAESSVEMKTPVPTAEASAPVASPKPKIPRHCLFERQLKVDQDGCINPDYMTPFQSKEDAVKRLIRYHCMYQQDELIPSDEEIEIEKIALDFKDKFRVLASKYQYLLLQESMRMHRTSETCLVNELLINDAQNEIKELKELREEQLNPAAHNANNLYQNTSNHSTCSNDGKFVKKESEYSVQMSKLKSEEFNYQSENYQSNINYGNNLASLQDLQQYSQPSHMNSFGSSGAVNTSVKDEIKCEPNDLLFDKCENATGGKTLTTAASTATTDVTKNASSSYTKSFNSFNVKNEKDRNIYSNSSLGAATTNTLSSSYGSAKNLNFVKRETEIFDIESEITPSFIMKKPEAAAPASLSATTSAATSDGANHDTMANNGFSMDYFNAQTETNDTNVCLSSLLDVKKKDEEDAAKAEQYDEWLCIQKELNLMTEKKVQSSMVANHEHKLSEIFDAPVNKSVENHLNDLFNSNSSEASDHGSGKDHHNIANNLHLSEFFNPDSIASKSVENRLEAMFGGSPAGVEKNDQDTVESRLDEIFNGSSSPQQHYAMIDTSSQNKREWNSGGDLLSSSTTSASTTGNFNKRACMVSTYMEESHVTSNHQRWMMDHNQFDFMSDSATSSQNDATAARSKRSWNGDIVINMEHMSSNKKMCFNSKVDSDLEHDLLGLGASESNDAIASELMRHNMNQHNTALQDGNSHLHQNMSHMHNNVLMQMPTSGNVHHMQQQSQQLHDHQSQHHSHHHHQSIQSNAPSLMNQSSTMFETSLNNSTTNANMSGSSSNTSISSNFDEDINRHVQNAIDSILNLHSSENDSLNFSLEHSMGSFLTDSPLDQTGHHNPGSANSSHCPLSSNISKQRRHLNRMDDLGDCLISGAGIGNQTDGGSLMVESPTSVVMTGAANASGNSMSSTNITDFNCVNGIEEAVKSIMTS